MSAQKELTKFYKPYLSDEDDDSSQDSYSSNESTGSDSESDRLSQVVAARQNLFVSNGAPISSGNDVTPSPLATTVLKQTKTAFTGSKNTTTIMINSSDRDTTIYPQPTFFTLRLPRIYRNVVGINVTQIKLLSSFYYFSAEKANTDLTVLELDRIKAVNGVGVANPINVFIRDGTYDSNSLVAELNNQLNQAPIYNRISFAAFMEGFVTTGDLAPLFNDPGDTTYNPVTGIFETLTSKSQIVARYFNNSNTLGVQYYSSSQTTVAYYYAMLRDLTISQRSVTTRAPLSPFAKNCTAYVKTGASPVYESLNYRESDPLAQTYLSGATPYDRIVYGFQGLTDLYILYLLNDPENLAILNQYRADNTWDGFLVNRYITSYDPTVGRVTIYSNQLNTSIVTTLNNQYQTILIRELTRQGITSDQVAEIQAAGDNMNGVIIDMYNKIQRTFTNFFAIPYGAYSASFYTDLTNELQVFDASGRYGWNLTYKGLPQGDDSVAIYPDASGYWPQIKFNPLTVGQDAGGDYYYPVPWGGATARYTYSSRPDTETGGFLALRNANEEFLGYQDISFNVLPTAYNSVKFTSRCRQQMFIETIPPFKAEIPSAVLPAETYYLDTVNTPFLFADAAGRECRLDPKSSDFVFFDVSQNMFDGPGFMRHLSGTTPEFMKFIREIAPVDTPLEVPPPGYIGLYTFRPHIFFRISHNGYPVPQYYEHVTTKFRSDLYIEREDGQPFGTQLDFYWYRSRAAYMADVSHNLVNIYDNNSKHYFQHVVIPADLSGVKITLDFLSFKQSYGTVIAKNPIANFTFRIFAVRHDPYGTFTYPDTTDYREMPVDYDYLASKNTPASNFPTAYNTLFNSSLFRNTYDLSGVSNNLLDHFILTTDFSHYDPYNMSVNTTISQLPLRYVFQFKTPAPGPPVGSSSWSQYFGTGSANAIYDISGGYSYYNSTSAALELANGGLGRPNEFVFVNWFRAGAATNLFNSAINPSSVPEHTVAPLPVDSSPFTVFSPIPYSNVTFPNLASKYKLSPFVLCKNTTSVSTDISFNDLSGTLNPGEIYLGPDSGGTTNNITGIMGIAFTPPRGRYVVPTRVVLKYAYIQPSFDSSLVKRGRVTPLQLSTGAAYRYYTLASSAAYTGAVPGDLATWDDQFYQNRRNLVLGVYRISDVINKSGSSIYLHDALSTLSLKKVTQVGQYSSNIDQDVKYSRNRTPDWGTYYIYEAQSKPTRVWYSWDQTVTNGTDEAAATATTRWAAVALASDLSGSIFTAGQTYNVDNISYYSNVLGSGLCLIPFAPVLTPVEKGLSQDLNPAVAPFAKSFSDPAAWQIGSFTGLTYTTLPYLPVTRGSALDVNPFVFNGGDAVCVETLGNSGLCMGANTTYLGSAGPLCLGISADDGSVVSPNYRTPSSLVPTFFNIRINVRISDARYNPLVDLGAFGGTGAVSRSLVDTQTYLYDLTTNPESDYIDISGGWGQERASRFIRFDDDSGFNYLSYMPSINIKKGYTYGINVRGYVPTVKFLTGVRIVGKNWTDFGVLALNDLIGEIAELRQANIAIDSNGRLTNNPARVALRYTYDYALNLLLFDEQFIGVFRIGQGTINPAYQGVIVTSLGFGDFIKQFIGYNTEIQTLVKGITSASDAALAGVKQYIVDNYTDILPPVVLQRSRFTDPVMFTLQFKSTLVEPQASAFNQWGLGWNLGFDKIDTIYNTRHVGVTFIRIVDDYIYLKLNEELNLNNLDVSNKEDLALTRESAGQSKQYYGKILLNTFGSFSQTLIQAAVPLITPIGRLDKLTFQLVDAYNQNINNQDCEYNIVLSVDEMVDHVDTGGMLVKGT